MEVLMRYVIFVPVVFALASVSGCLNPSAEPRSFDTRQKAAILAEEEANSMGRLEAAGRNSSGDRETYFRREADRWRQEREERE